MYKYCDDIKRLIDMGLNPEYISELSNCRVQYLRKNYQYSKKVCVKINLGKRKPSIKDVTIAHKLLKRGHSITSVLSKFAGRYDVNYIYESLKDKFGYSPEPDIETQFFEDCVMLLKSGLSLRNCAKLFEEANEGFTPDHSSLRKRLIKVGKYVCPEDYTSDKRLMGRKEKILCLKIIKKYNLAPTLEDFISLYFKYFTEFKPNDVFKILINSAQLEVRKCNICLKEIIAERYERVCKSCKRKNKYKEAV
ncbi:hypothetical protein [Flexistipes sp.]|uniref:hypothetical protein n=1 Tax=Flexistipes sp. TaxID=3088135 RepID=UPI002E1F6D7A|nr:hypothetical protein [Flexistipes sp.]